MKHSIPNEEENEYLTKLIDIEPAKEPDFVKLYLKDIGKIFELNKPAQIIFGQFLRLVTYNPKDRIHNVVSLGTSSKRAIKALFKTSTGPKADAVANSQYSKGLKSLLASTLVTELSPDLFYISHEICSKTNWANTEAMRAIKIETIYESNNRTLITFVEDNKEYTKREIENQIQLAKQ